MTDEFFAHDKPSLRAIWFIAFLGVLNVERKPDRKTNCKAGLEAFFNMVRPNPPTTWRNGVKVFNVK